MFFTKVGKVLAYLGFGIGILYIAYSLWLGFGAPEVAETTETARRYFVISGARKIMNQGFITILASVLLGIFCETTSKLKACANK